MNYFLRFAAYLFHPLFIPLIGAITYYNITPRFIEPLLVKSKIFAIIIITILIPIITFFLLKNLRLISSIHLRDVEERKYPLMIQCILILLIIKMEYSPYESIEMYYFFLGILFTSISALILVFFKFKASLHQMGISGLTMFIIALSIHFKVNMLLGIAIFFICNGWVASSRLHTNSHSVPELITGFVIGVFPQFILLSYWL